MGRNCGWLTAGTAFEYRERLKARRFLPDLLVSQDRLDVHAVYIPEVDIAKVKKGMRVEIKLDAFGEKIFNGKIDFIYPEKKEIFGITYYRARILFNEKDLKDETILPGMTAEASIPYEKKENILAIKRGVAKHFFK